jgi:CIC family chloride channel protein
MSYPVAKLYRNQDPPVDGGTRTRSTIDGRQRLIMLENLRHRLATADAIPQLAILGVLAGLSTGMVMLMFRAIIELPLMALLPGHNSENFEGLAPLTRVCLVVGGAILLGLWTQRLTPMRRSVGVVHVMERLNAHQGRMPLPNAIVQFIGGAAALLTGQSGGREGPAIHLGAAASSLLGQFLELPNNSIRTLVACGTAVPSTAPVQAPMTSVGPMMPTGTRRA